MLGSLLAAAAFQIGPFYEQRPDDGFLAVRPFVSVEKGTSDVLWPLWTSHDGWWRFAFLAWWQDRAEDDSFQFTLLPLWFNGRDREGRSYAGLFPLGGYHPHVATLYDLKFALWPLWMQYRKPRGRDWLETNAVLFPFFSWRSDGSWGFWPVCGVNRQRESVHSYALWPLATWASYRPDRDTAGEGWSWMLWPLYGQVRREREKADMFLPPLFSYSRVESKTWKAEGHESPETRIRAPWPFFEYESSRSRDRISVWPLYERVESHAYGAGERPSSVVRFGWKLVELYEDETRVFPFWASGRNHFRLWPLWESETEGDVVRSRSLALFPIRWTPAVDRNLAPFWTFYSRESCPVYSDHSLLWGLIRWRTLRD